MHLVICWLLVSLWVYHPPLLWSLVFPIQRDLRGIDKWFVCPKQVSHHLPLIACRLLKSPGPVVVLCCGFIFEELSDFERISRCKLFGLLFYFVQTFSGVRILIFSCTLWHLWVRKFWIRRPVSLCLIRRASLGFPHCKFLGNSLVCAFLHNLLDLGFTLELEEWFLEFALKRGNWRLFPWWMFCHYRFSRMKRCKHRDHRGMIGWWVGPRRIHLLIDFYFQRHDRISRYAITLVFRLHLICPWYRSVLWARFIFHSWS